MVVSSFPTAHTDEPHGNHCHRLPYMYSFSKICSCSNMQLGIPPHLPLRPHPSHNTLITQTEKCWKSKQLRIKITSCFTSLRKMRSSHHLSSLQGLTRQTTTTLPTISWAGMKQVSNCVSNNARISSIKLVKKQFPLSCVLIK